MARTRSLKQIRAAAIIVENSRNGIAKSKGQVLKEAGFAPSVVSHPDRVFGSRSWKELIGEYLPDEEMLQMAKEGMYATKVHSSHTEPDREVPDWANRHKFWETGLKMKGMLEKDAVTVNAIVPVIISTTQGNNASPQAV